MFIEHLGGRKNLLGYLFIACCTFLTYQMQGREGVLDYLGLATVFGAMAAGVGTLVWGNVQEHKAKNGHTTQ